MIYLRRKAMLIVSQNKESVDRKGKGETIRHTICISDGCLEEIAEYPTKERCLTVLKDFF